MAGRLGLCQRVRRCALRPLGDATLATVLGLAILLRRPLRVARAGARAEVHTLVGRSHLLLYLYAVRSIVRVWPEVVPVVHDDGTLRWPARRLLRLLAPGIRQVAKKDGERVVLERLSGFPRTQELRRKNVRMAQLLDYYLLAGHDRVVGMDSDVLFLQRPERMVRWATTDGPVPGLYSPESAPKGPHWVPEAFPGTPYVPDICCGLVAIDRRTFPSLPRLEEYIARTPPDILWHGRFVTQMFHSLLLGAGDVQAQALGEDYRSGRVRWLGPSTTRVAYHYFASHGGRGQMANLVAERRQLLEACHSSLGRAAVAVYDRVFGAAGP